MHSGWKNKHERWNKTNHAHHALLNMDLQVLQMIDSEQPFTKELIFFTKLWNKKPLRNHNRIAAIKSWPRPAFFIRRSAMLRWQVTRGVGRSNIIFHNLSFLASFGTPKRLAKQKHGRETQRWNPPTHPPQTSPVVLIWRDDQVICHQHFRLSNLSMRVTPQKIN